MKPISDHVYQVEDLRNGNVDDIQALRLKFYFDSSLDTEAIFPHILSSETGMAISRLLSLVESEEGAILVSIRRKGVNPEEDTFEPLKSVYEDVPKLLHKLLNRNSTPTLLPMRAQKELGL